MKVTCKILIAYSLTLIAKVVILINDIPGQDVCLSSVKVALEFYHAARDAILLYEAVIPVKVCV